MALTSVEGDSGGGSQLDSFVVVASRTVARVHETSTLQQVAFDLDRFTCARTITGGHT